MYRIECFDRFTSTLFSDSFLFFSFFSFPFLHSLSRRSFPLLFRFVFLFLRTVFFWFRFIFVPFGFGWKPITLSSGVTCPFIDKKLIRWKQNYNHSIRLWHTAFLFFSFLCVCICMYIIHINVWVSARSVHMYNMFDEIAHDNNIFVNVIACELVHLQLS